MSFNHHHIFDLMIKHVKYIPSKILLKLVQIVNSNGMTGSTIILRKIDISIEFMNKVKPIRLNNDITHHEMKKKHQP